MTVTIDQERLERLNDPNIHLREGAGRGVNGSFDVCLVQAADWLAGGDGSSDRPTCVSVKIGAYCIRLNDSVLFKNHRDMLKPYAAKIVGTAGPDGPREVKRAYLFADYAIRVMTPIWLRSDPEHRFDEEAASLEALAPITSEETRSAARAVADKVYKKAVEIRRAAYEKLQSAAYAADAASAAYAADAADAASAAYAADAAYAAYAAYAADAASAAYAADAAYAAYDAKRLEVLGDELRAKALECLEAVIAIPADEEKPAA